MSKRIFAAIGVWFFLTLCVLRPAFATTNNTITIDASLADWQDNEKLGTSSGRQAYFTWDASNFYLGFDRASTFENTDIVWIYISTVSPTSTWGTFTSYNQGGTHTLPFRAGYCYLRQPNGEYNNLRRWNGSSWLTDQTWTGSAAQDWANGRIEASIPRAEIGNPSSIRIVIFIANNTNNWVFGISPRENPVDAATGRIFGLSWYYPNCSATGVFPNLMRYRYPGVVIADVCQSANVALNEYIQLYNPNDEPVYLSNLQGFHGLPASMVYYLMRWNGTSALTVSQTVVSTNTVPSRGFLLIRTGELAVSVSTDVAGTTNMAFDGTDDAAVISFSTATAAAGRLAAYVSTLVDKVGWGAPPADGIETTAVSALAANNSIQRKAWSTTASSQSMLVGGEDEYAGHFMDTHVNSTDFVIVVTSWTPRNTASPREGFLGNCWHIPNNTSDLGGTSMLNPLSAIYKNTAMYVYNGNYYTGSGNPGDQSAFTLYYKAATDGSWSSVPGAYDSVSGSNKYWKADFTNSWTRGTTVQYYLKADYADSHDTTYLYWGNSQSRRSYEVFIATNNPYSFVVLNTTPTVPGLSYPKGGEILIINSPINITWNNSTDADSDAIKYIIELSTNNGSTWEILTSTPTASPYGWTPATERVSNQCYVRIKSTDTFSVSSSSQSQVFTISSGNESPNLPSLLSQFTSFGGAWAAGDWKSYQQIRTTFTLTDPDGADQVRFNIQFSTFSNFSYNHISATSAFMAQGATNYLTPLLPDGTWYWRVRCGDNSAASNDWNYSYSSMTVVNNRHFGVDVSSPIPSAPTLSRSHIMGIGADISWSVAVDTYSSVANYKIYRATYNFSSTGVPNVTLLGTLTNATTHQDTSGLSANTTYFYCLTAADNAGNTSLKTSNTEIRTARISIDGSASDWATSVESPWVNESTTTLVSAGGNTPYYEWSWRDKSWEQRTDSVQDDRNFDLRFFRVAADEEYIYFYTKSDNLTDKDFYHFAVAIDTGGVTGLNWLGDDSNANTNGGAAMGLGDEYGGGAMKAAALVAFRYISSAGTDFRIHLYKNGGASWDNPALTGAGNTACWLTTGDGGWMEAKVRRSDVDATGSKTLKFAAAVFENQTGLIGDVDSTKYYAPDALDAMSIARISAASTYNDSQWGMNSWDEDISDSDGDFWAMAQIDASGLKLNRPPAQTTLLLPVDGAGVNTHTPAFSWNAASEPDSGDAVTSYMIEISTTSDFSSSMHWRVNVAVASWTVPQGFLDQGQYYWRVKARDRSGAVSVPSVSRSFIVDTSPPTVKYNTPSVIGSTMPVAGSSSGVNGNYYVGNPGNIIDIDFLNLSIGTKTITVDGNPADWTGEKHSTIHGVAIRDGEWIYTGSKGDAREDLGSDTPNGDLTEFRVTCDANSLYILIKSSDITNIDKVHYAVGFDTDGDYTNGYSWLGDDSVSLGNSVPLARGYTYVDKMYLLRCAVTGSPTIESWNGATWAAPADYAVSISAANDSVEARISLADLGIGALPKTVRVVAASFINTLGWANAGDTTADIAGAGAGAYDVIDGLVGDFGVQMNYWGREIGTNDLDIGRYYDIRLGGEKSNISTIDYNIGGGAWINLSGAVAGGADFTTNWGSVAGNDALGLFARAPDSSTGCVVNIRAYDTGGNSITQLGAFHYWKGGPPSAVTNLSSLSGSLPGHINLSWTAPGDDGNFNNFDAGSRIHIASFTAANYPGESGWDTAKRNNAEIQISTSGAAPGQTWGRIVTGLTEGGTYYFRIWHRDEAGNWATISGGATTWARVDDVAPAAITNLSASCASDGTGIVTLTWTAPREDGPTAGGAASSYEVRYATWDFTTSWADGTQWTIGVPAPSAPGTTQTLRLISLANNTTYYFHVKSTDDKSNVSPLDTGTTAQCYVQHIVISEIQISGGGVNDEFIELYNPMATNITIPASWRVRKRDASGADTPAGGIAMTNFNGGVIPAGGYFLIAQSPNYDGAVSSDAYFTTTAQLVDNYAVYISTSSNAYSEPASPLGYTSIDMVGWGTQPASGAEGGAVFASNPAAHQSMERKGLDGNDPTVPPGDGLGNSWDTNNNSNDFVLRTTADPQNSSSNKEPDTTTPNAINTMSALTGAGNGHIWLSWTAPSDDNTNGDASGIWSYDIRYRTGGAVDDGNWAAASQIANEPTPAAAGTQQWLLVTGLVQDVTYYFKMKSADKAGNNSALSNSAYAYAQSSGAILINEVAPSGGNFVEFLVAKPGCFRAVNFYGRIGGDLISISTFSITGVWSDIIPAGTFIVLNMITGADESAITGGVINMYKNAALTATDNNFILSDNAGITISVGDYSSGNVIDYLIFENQDTTRDAKVTSTLKKMIQRLEWSSILDTSSYDPLAFDAQTARNLAAATGNSLARNLPVTDTNSKADWSFQSKSTGSANSASTAYAGYGVCSAVPEVALPDEVFTATFTYSGTTGAGAFTNDDIRHTFTVDIPDGWTPPQTASPAELGFTTNTFSLTALYSITIATLPAGGWRVMLPMGDLTGGTSYKITYRGKAPSSEQTYTFTARSDYKGVNVADIGASSQPYVIVDGTPPGAVTNLAAVLTGDLRITLYWTAPGNNNYTGVLDEGSKFHIASTTVLSDALNAAYWSTAKRDAAEIKISTSGINPGVSLSSGPYILTEGATYYFRLWTKDRAGNWSAISSGATAYCTATPPDAIANLSAISTNIGTIDLSWNATGDDGSADNIAGGMYALQRSTWPNFQSIVWSTSNAQIAFSTNVTAGSAQGYRDFGLTIGATYYYRIWLRDENITGWSAVSNGATTWALRSVADGGAFAVYYDTTSYQTPTYRGWMNGFFSSEYSLDNSAAVEPGLSGNYASAASPTKNESVFLAGGKRTATYSGLWAYTHNGSTWTYLNFTPTPAYTDTTVGTVRRFDVAYEQKSGRAIAVYRNQNFSTSRPVYRIFNNGVWTSETDTALDFGSAIHWIKLYSKPQSDEIVMVVLLDNFAIVTAVWDGSAWSSGTTLPYAAGGTDQQCFDGTYDTLWKRFVLVASSRTVNGAVQYTVWDSTGWATPQQFTFGIGGNPLSSNDVRWIKLAAHPSSNEILMAVSDGDSTGPNIGAAVWNGSSWSQYATALAANSGAAVGDRPFDVTYSQSSGKGLIAYGKSSVAGRPYYITYDGSWSAESYAGSVGSANIQRLALAPLPSSSEILMLFNDADGKIGSSRWDGSSWSSPVVLESTSSTRESFSAAYRYDQRYIADTTSPGAISTLTGIVLGDGEVRLTWTAPGDDNFTGALKCGSRYLFVYSTATPTDSELTWPSTYSALISTYSASPGGTQQKIIANLPYETTWYFRLRTRDEAGNWSGLSNAATVFVLVTPGMITDLAAAPGSRGRTIALNWTAPGDDGYTGVLTDGSKFAIQRSTWADVVWSTGSIDTIVFSTTNVNPGERQYYTLTGLSSGATYYMSIWTCDDMENWSIRSAVVDAWAQVALLSVTVAPTTYYDFGTLGTAVSSNSATAITVVNSGNVNETYKMRCSNSATWTAGSSAGYDIFVAHTAYHGSRPTINDFNANDNKLTLADKTSSSSVFSINGTQTAANIDPFTNDERSLWLRLDMPLATSTSSQQTITVTVTAEEP